MKRSPAVFMLYPSMTVNLNKWSTFFRGGKFSSGRDAVLYDMEMGEWAMASSGAYAMIENLAGDLEGIIDAFPESINENMVANAESLAELVGWFLLIHEDDGLFVVIEYSNLSDLRHAYRDATHEED